jgi:hypothetical protein
MRFSPHVISACVKHISRVGEYDVPEESITITRLPHVFFFKYFFFYGNEQELFEYNFSRHGDYALTQIYFHKQKLTVVICYKCSVFTHLYLENLINEKKQFLSL